MSEVGRPVRLTMYSRAGCHLCDDARAVIRSVAVELPIELEEVDIDTSDELLKAYLERIPVIEHAGSEWFEFTVDAGRLAELVTRVASIGAGEHHD